MDFKKLEYLETIYRVRSFSKAAEEHYISQPSISNAIQKLESELGVTLIDRNSKPLSFTSEGLHFMNHVYTILGAVKEAETDMRALIHSSGQELQIAVHSTIGDHTLTKIFLDFHDRYPRCNLSLLEMSNQTMLERLLKEEIDLAYSLIPENIDLEIYETIPLQRCELQAMIPKGHIFEQYDCVSLSMMKNEKIITFMKDALIYQRLEKEFATLQISPPIRSQPNIRVQQNLVEQNYGIAFVTMDNLSTLHDTNTYSIRPLKEQIHFPKGFILKRNRSKTPAVNNLIHYVQHEILAYSSDSEKEHNS